MTNSSLIFANELEKVSLPVSVFPNKAWKGNCLCLDFRQIDQNSQNSGKLVPKKIFFIKLTYLKEYFKINKSFLQSLSDRQMVSNTKNERLKSLKSKY